MIWTFRKDTWGIVPYLGLYTNPSPTHQPSQFPTLPSQCRNVALFLHVSPHFIIAPWPVSPRWPAWARCRSARCSQPVRPPPRRRLVPGRSQPRWRRHRSHPTPPRPDCAEPLKGTFKGSQAAEYELYRGPSLPWKSNVYYIYIYIYMHMYDSVVGILVLSHP